MSSGSVRFAVLLATVALAHPALAEIYRWRDAQGREHFTTNLQQVPADQRAEARRAAERAKSRIQHYTPPPPARPDRPAPAPKPLRPASGLSIDCDALQRQARKLRNTVAYHRARLERHERRADDISRSAFSRRRHEARGEASQVWLAKAEAALERFSREQRQRGVPPGCLR